MTKLSGDPGNRTVIDTNVFISGMILPRGNPHRLLEAFRARTFTLVICQEQRDELAGVLQRPRIRQRYDVADEDVAALLYAIDTTAVFTPLSGALPVYVRDPKDEMILASALSGRADYLVSGDEDLLVLRDDPRLGMLRILTVREFMELLDQLL
jgi:putative PIN family toxin of toxin-antitoxin system